MDEFVDRLGLRDYVTGPGRPLYFHVAGSNGKGSTVCFLQHLLHAHGLKTGACYSPYVRTVRERVQVGLDLIEKEDFARYASVLMETGETLEDTEFGGPTEFEMKTAMGFLCWAEMKVEAVALETGLGGRLDATNIVDPAVSIITSISLDHTAYLGDTIEKIAFEKAGIIKPGRPVVVGSVPDAALRVIREVALERGSEVHVLGEDFTCADGRFSFGSFVLEGIELGMEGAWQWSNAGCALAALMLAGITVKDSATLSALKAVQLPGRLQVFEYKGKKVIVDGAHNPEAVGVLCDWVRENCPGSVAVVAGGLRGHDFGLVLEELRKPDAEIYLTPLDEPRSLTVEELAEHGERVSARSEDAFEKAVASGRDVVLVAGSFILAGEILKSVDSVQSSGSIA